MHTSQSILIAFSMHPCYDEINQTNARISIGRIGLTKPNPEQSGDGKLQGLSETASYLAYPKEVLMMKKFIVAGALVLFIFSFSFKLFSDWDASNDYRHALFLNGYHVENSTTSYEPGQNLVPKGSLLTVGDVDEITYTYELLVLPDRSITSDFQSVVLETAEGKTGDTHGLFNIETEVLFHEALKGEDHDRMTVQSTITLAKPTTEEQAEFLNGVRNMSFEFALNADE